MFISFSLQQKVQQWFPSRNKVRQSFVFNQSNPFCYLSQLHYLPHLFIFPVQEFVSPSISVHTRVLLLQQYKETKSHLFFYLSIKCKRKTPGFICKFIFKILWNQYLVPIFSSFLTCPPKMIETAFLNGYISNLYLTFLQTYLTLYHVLNTTSYKNNFQIIIQCKFQFFAPHILPLIKHIIPQIFCLIIKTYSLLLAVQYG